jgi:oxygen-dependent protoporphyrinogen oxidase
MGELTDTLAESLNSELRMSLPVKHLDRDRQSFIVNTDAGAIVADAVVLACPSYESAKIIKDLAPDASQALLDIPFAPVDVACQGYSDQDIEKRVNGFGVLIPRSENIRSLGCLWSDSIFPGQAPSGYHLLRTIIGGAHDPDVVELSDKSLSEVAYRDLNCLLGVHQKPGFEKIYRHPKGIAQYIVGHLNRVAASEQLERDLPGLFFTGASYRGVSVNGCIKDAFKVARRLWDMERNSR